MPLVSVIMPTYRQGAFISRAIISLLQQTFQKWELIIINDGRAIGFLLVVKSRHIVGTARRPVLQLSEVGASLRYLLAVRVAKQIILEGGSRIDGRGDVAGSAFGRLEPDVTNLILRVGGYRIVWKFINHRLISLNGGIVCSLFFACQSDVELRASGVFSVRSRADDGGENVDRPIH